MEHTGATEDYAHVLAGIRTDMTVEDAYPGRHVDGDTCEFELAVVWRCAACGREEWQDVTAERG